MQKDISSSKKDRILLQPKYVMVSLLVEIKKTRRISLFSFPLEEYGSFESFLLCQLLFFNLSYFAILESLKKSCARSLDILTHLEAIPKKKCFDRLEDRLSMS